MNRAKYISNLYNKYYKKSQKGIAQIPIMIGMLILALVIPFTTQLVQQNQENRSMAYVPECDIDADCSVGYECIANKCVKDPNFKGKGTICLDSAGCSAGYFCSHEVKTIANYGLCDYAKCNTTFKRPNDCYCDRTVSASWSCESGNCTKTGTNDQVPGGIYECKAAVVPTVKPTVVPTAKPTVAPTKTPTRIPTQVPTKVPTLIPTLVPPTQIPTVGPTITPTVAPTIIPTVGPTITWTITPTVIPTITPTIIPTITWTITPTITPTPTMIPILTVIPTSAATCVPCANSTSKLDGDANCDGKINIVDLSIWREEFSQKSGATLKSNTWNADFNCDGYVNEADRTIWENKFILLSNAN